MISEIIAIEELTEMYTDYTLRYKFCITPDQISFNYQFVDKNGSTVESDGDSGPNEGDIRGGISMVILHMKQFYHTLPNKLTKDKEDA